jgi:hypothetical protein
VALPNFIATQTIAMELIAPSPSLIIWTVLNILLLGFVGYRIIRYLRRRR